MPFKSEAQRRKFGEMVKQGKMSQATFDEWNSATPAGIPERIGQKNVRSFDQIREIKKVKGVR